MFEIDPSQLAGALLGAIIAIAIAVVIRLHSEAE
jgi:hypothetical protein